MFQKTLLDKQETLIIIQQRNFILFSPYSVLFYFKQTSIKLFTLRYCSQQQMFHYRYNF